MVVRYADDVDGGKGCDGAGGGNDALWTSEGHGGTSVVEDGVSEDGSAGHAQHDASVAEPMSLHAVGGGGLH